MNGADLPGLFFLDTSIFVYSFDHNAPEKQQIARRLIQTALGTQRGIISTQVVQEFLNVALRRFARPMTTSEAREYLRVVLVPLCQHFPSMAFYDRTLLLREETGFSFYDALVVAAALESGCSTLLSEDLQHGRNVQGVALVNPFADLPPAS
jgi:predicted nucleic acid-binding protein